VKSKFWALMDDDDTDDKIVQSPYMPDLVRQAAVHGFAKEQLVEAEMALQDSSIQRRVEASLSPTTSDTKVVLVRNIIRAWTARQRALMTPWSGKLPRPRTSPAMTLGDCTATFLRGQRLVAGGTLAEALGRSFASSPAKTVQTLNGVHGDHRSSLCFKIKTRLIRYLRQRYGAMQVPRSQQGRDLWQPNNGMQDPESQQGWVDAVEGISGSLDPMTLHRQVDLLT
jgi:hypothetical protein